MVLPTVSCGCEWCPGVIHLPGRIQPLHLVRFRNMTLTSTSAAVKLEALFEEDHGDLFDVVMEDIVIKESNRGIGEAMDVVLVLVLVLGLVVREQ